MSWNDGDEGPWGGGNSGENSKKPWNSGKRSRNNQPNLEDIIRSGQENLKKMLPPGKGMSSVFMGALLVLVGLWLSTGIYRVQPSEQGLVLRFGKMSRIAQPGLNYHLPSPIEQVVIKNVTAVNRVESGTLLQNREEGEEGLMLTGDENIVLVNFTVLWIIKDIEQYVFNAKSPDETVKSAAESVVREIIAQTPISSALTEGRGAINQKAQQTLQSLMDAYKLGIHIQEVLMGSIDPPSAVIDAYRDVQRAKADQERSRNDAEAYRNSILPTARGEVQKIIMAADGYRQKVVAQAQGNASRFLALLTQYSLAPQITSQRLYLETLEDVLREVPKIVMDHGGASQGVLPYLPLPGLAKKKAMVSDEKSD
ncbi:MAG: FtsH protease activity modulator HflK [Alphaproteobacteria bacterium]